MSSTTEVWALPNGQILYGVHPSTDCAGRGCVLHHPSEHQMVTYPMIWRDDRGFMERQCPHGVGHPDPDEAEYFRTTGRSYMSIHGCCLERCCEAAKDELFDELSDLTD